MVEKVGRTVVECNERHSECIHATKLAPAIIKRCGKVAASSLSGISRSQLTSEETTFIWASFATRLPQNMGIATVMELTKSQNESKQLYDKYVSDKLAAGFTPRSDWIAALKASNAGTSNYTNIWAGQSGSQQFYVLYRYNNEISSWELTTEAL